MSERTQFGSTDPKADMQIRQLLNTISNLQFEPVNDEMCRALIAKHREIYPGAGWPSLDAARELIAAANEADQKCQKESCKDIGCNGFLCANALRAAILKAREDALEELPDAIDLYRLLKNNRLRKRADIAKAIASAIRQHSQKGER